MAESGFAVFTGMYWVFSVFSSGIGILSYVLGALGLMGMLKSCGYDKPYLAWIPVANIYALGKLAEMYDDKKPSKKHGKRLLTLCIVEAVLVFIFVVILLSMIVSLGLSGAFDQSTTAEDLTGALTSEIVAVVLTIIPFGLAVSVISIIYTVFYYIALWRVYMIFAPESATGYLILCIFVSIASPIIWFCMRDKAPMNLRGRDNGSTDNFTPYGGANGQNGQSGPQNPYKY